MLHQSPVQLILWLLLLLSSAGKLMALYSSLVVVVFSINSDITVFPPRSVVFVIVPNKGVLNLTSALGIGLIVVI
jgi:hypothetical protein